MTRYFKPRNRVTCNAAPLNAELHCRQNNDLFEHLIVDRKINILFMCMERSICEAFPLILSKKSTFFQVNMIHFITRASAIRLLPLFWWLLTLPETCTDKENNLKVHVKFLLIRIVFHGNRNYKCLLKKSHRLIWKKYLRSKLGEYRDYFNELKSVFC